MKRFDLRIEQPDGMPCADTYVSADSLEDARKKVQGLLYGVKKWDWRGAVAFVNGAVPAEEKGIPGQRVRR